jgi:quercetin dioxygenase-like cupin family protein
MTPSFRWLYALTALASASTVAADAEVPVPKDSLRISTSEVTWKEAPSTMPPGTQIAILEGNPKEAALFTMRVKLPAGFVIPPHTHPSQERVTIVSGTVHLGYGTTLDKAKSATLPPGSYYVTAPGVPHFLWSDQEVVLQLTNVGPWKVEPIPAAKK